MHLALLVGFCLRPLVVRPPRQAVLSALQALPLLGLLLPCARFSFADLWGMVLSLSSSLIRVVLGLLSLLLVLSGFQLSPLLFQ